MDIRRVEGFYEPPKLPEHYKAGLVEGMLPGDIAFPSHNLILVDRGTGYLFVDTTRDLDKSSRDPTKEDIQDSTSRIALMRVYKNVGSRMIDGFIADLRYLEPGTLISATLIPTGEEDEREKTFIQTKSETIVQLLAAITTGIEGNPEISGDPVVYDEANILMRTFDQRRTPTDEQPKAAVEQAGPVVDFDSTRVWLNSRQVLS